MSISACIRTYIPAKTSTQFVGQNPKEFLKGFKGYLHVNRYAGYNGLEDVTLVGCFAHAPQSI